jgi:hypothetical protein
LPLTAAAIIAITGVTLAGYLVLRATQPEPGAVIAAVLPGSRAMAVLEQQRQQMIVMDAAAHTTRLIGVPRSLPCRTPSAQLPVAAQLGWSACGPTPVPHSPLP